MKESANVVRGSRKYSRLVNSRMRDLCFCCEKRKADVVHHITYINSPHEQPEDLVAICHKCHGQIHSMARKGTPMSIAHIKLKQKYFKKLSIEEIEHQFREDLKLNGKPNGIVFKIVDFPFMLSMKLRKASRISGLTMGRYVMNLIEKDMKKKKIEAD